MSSVDLREALEELKIIEVHADLPTCFIRQAE